jgi:hypothetical protein
MAENGKSIQDLKAEMERELAELKAMKAALQQQSGGGINAGELREILTTVTEAAAAPSNLLASKLKPENADHLHVSVFEHPKGGIDMPKPALHREVIWLGRVRPEDLTYAETLAVNALSQSLARSQRRLCRDGQWKAIVSDDDKTLTISLPVKTQDDRADLPSFLAIVTELTSGEKPLEQVDLLNEITLMKQQIASMQAAHA